jgi:hypothetical protein
MASTYTNANADLTNSFTQGYGPGGGQNIFDFIRSGLASSGVMDPNSILSNFSNAAPGLMEMALGATSPYVKSIDAYTNALIPQAVQAGLSPFSGENAVYSSGAVGAATSAAGNIGLQGQQQKLAAQTGLVGQLLGGGLSALTSGYGSTAGLLSGMFSNAADLATPVLQEKQDPLTTFLPMAINLFGALTGTGGITGLITGLGSLFNQK